MSELIYKDESYQIIGACYEVYNRLGHGFLEAVYHECLCIELDHENIPYVKEKEIELRYRDQNLKKKYYIDFDCYEKILVEIKAVSDIMDKHRSQCLNYLNGTNYQLGLIVNSGHHPDLEYERLVL